jgi:hypothetical protein
MKFFLLLCSLVLFAPSAFAVTQSEDMSNVMPTSYLRELCTSKRDTNKYATCLYFIVAYNAGAGIERYNVYQKIGLKGTPSELDKKYASFCLPALVDIPQVAEVFVKFANGHPEKLHVPAIHMLAIALETYFPCKPK